MIIVALGPIASAHPLGNFTVNLYSGVRLSAEHVTIDYVLEMAEIPTQEQKPGMDLDADGEISPEERQGWADRAAAQLLTNLHMVANGLPIELTLIEASLQFREGQAGLDLLYMNAMYQGELPASGRVDYRDDNYKGRPGWREITVTADASSPLLTSSVPEESVSDALRSYPPGQVDDALDVKEAAFSFQSSGAPVEETTPDPDPGGPGSSGSPAGSGSGLTGLLASTADQALVPILALAFGFGFLHALGPGHGKIVIAASGISRSIRLRHALSIGGVVAAMHAVSVVALGLIALSASRLVSSEETFAILQIVSAVVILAIGATLLVVRLRQRREGRDGGAHGHVHDRDPAAPRTPGLDRASLVAIAVSGGLVPSPTAVVVMLGAISAGRIPVGIALVVAFSIGLATALVAVGVLSVYARTLTDRLQVRFAGWLPIAAAAAILIVGIVLTVNAVLSQVS